MEAFFRFKERNTDLRTELIAGVVTFMTMAYIIFVNPGILSSMFGDAAAEWIPALATATTVGAALMCLAMGLLTNRPLALASGMGLNAMVAFSVVLGAGVPWQVGMAVVFVQGLIILLLVLTGFREAVMNAIPLNLKRAIGGGIGIFITFIGLKNGGIVVSKEATLVSLGDFTQEAVWVTLVGLVAIFAFMALRIKGDILWGILVAAAASLALGVTQLPTQIVAAPDFSTFGAPFMEVDGQMALLHVFTPAVMVFVFSMMLTDFFDTMGTVVAVGEQAGFVDEKGQVPEIRNILAVDSTAAVVGGAVGASSITTYIESASGVAEGGRTGLTAIVVGLLFAVATFFTPVIAMIGGAGSVTAGALIIVGFLMMKTIADISWSDFEEAFPAFMTIVGIPLTFNIAWGIGLGFISFIIIKVLHRKAVEVHPLMYLAGVAFAVALALY
ncbi:MAG: NCS2 family permease [Actinobacteria bacterium]|nr:NCS2 family permease [Actinomycetota bacterium]MCL5887601.1 NCS2 family permease [Actinomycetota bacterium]